MCRNGLLNSFEEHIQCHFESYTKLYNNVAIQVSSECHTFKGVATYHKLLIYLVIHINQFV